MDSPFKKDSAFSTSFDVKELERVRAAQKRLERREPIERTSSKDDLDQANYLLGNALQDLDPGSGVYHLVEEARALIYQQLA